MEGGSEVLESGPDVVQTKSEFLAQSSTLELIGEKSAPPNYYFGCRFWHPKWLQIFASAKFYTFCLCFISAVQGALVSGFSSVVISSIERRFQLNSTAVGFLLVSFDLTVVFSILFVSYFGDKGHKSHWIGYGTISIGLGALIFALPQFLFGNYQVGITGNFTQQACVVSGEVPYADCDSSSNIIAYCIILFGNIIIGIGSGPLYTIGISYIDDITLPKYVPIHLGCLFVCLALGPALGYGLGGVFLSIYVDPWIETQLTEIDPGWVGAWWIGFIVCGVVALIGSIPFFLFPQHLSNYEEVVKARRGEHAKVYVSKQKEEKTLKNQLKAFPSHLLELLKSPSFVFVSLGLAFLFLTFYGMVAFGPKFIESVFNVPPSTSSLLAGAVGGLGTLVGAIISYFLKANPKKAAVLTWVCSFLTIPMLIGFFATCPSLDIAGINVPYQNNSYITKDVTISSCNTDCMCTSSIYEPVCGADNITYFSPCRAGCMKRPDENNISMTIFENCTCVDDSLKLGNRSYYGVQGSATAVDGKCPQECTMLGLWLFLIGCVVFLVFVMRIPTLLISMRAVAEEQRSLALGMQSLLWRALGSIPGPLLYGVIFDSSCTYWQEECGRRGNCWVYNNDSIGRGAFSLSVCGVIISTVFNFLCWIFYPPIPCSKKGNDEQPPKEDIEIEKHVINPVYNHGDEVDA